MSNTRRSFDQSAAGGANAPHSEVNADFSSLFNFPSLGRLFEGADARPLEEMRARLGRTKQDLERVVRQGSKEDAERAARALAAYDQTLALLANLDEIRRQQQQQPSR